MTRSKTDNFLSPQSIKVALYSITFLAVSLLAFLASVPALAVKPLQYQAPDGRQIPAEVGLMVEALEVDPISRTITVDWYPSFTAPDCTKNPVVLDILLPQPLLDSSSPSWTAEALNLPLFQLNSTEYCMGRIPTLRFPSFRTVTKLLASSTDVPVLPGSGQSTLQDYPFDVYIAPFVFFLRNTETGVISAPNITNSFGVAVNFQISLRECSFITSQTHNLPRQTGLQIAFRVERSKATKVFVVMIAITNWLTAAAFLIVCAATLVYHPHKTYSEMLFVAVGAVFAFTSIRANFPGAPDRFGTTLDMYSTLPFLVIMSFCSFTLLLLILYRRIRNPKIMITSNCPNQQRSEQCNIPNKESEDEHSQVSTFLEVPTEHDPEKQK